MYTLYDELARAHLRELHDEARASSRARRVVHARRTRRRAERAAVRARLAAAAVR